MTAAYIALGANLGKRQIALRGAIEKIGKLPGTQVIAVSHFLQTEPVGGPAGQPKYLNAAAAIETTLEPEELLASLMAIEKHFGRNRQNEVRHGPRTLDLDLLLFGDVVKSQDGLTLPHPRMHERLFVLQPLAEIAGDVMHPVFKKTIQKLLADLTA